jgi:CBS domain-containing protein
MSLEALCRHDVASVDPDRRASEVARIMRDRHVGAVVVVDGTRPVGIVTDRDLAVRVLASGVADPAVKDVMTPEPVVAHRGSGLADAAQIMREHGVRRLPVVGDDGALVGLVALDDLLALLGEELASLAGAVGHERLREWREHGGEVPPELGLEPPYPDETPDKKDKEAA